MESKMKTCENVNTFLYEKVCSLLDDKLMMPNERANEREITKLMEKITKQQESILREMSGMAENFHRTEEELINLKSLNNIQQSKLLLTIKQKDEEIKALKDSNDELQSCLEAPCIIDREKDEQILILNDINDKLLSDIVKLNQENERVTIECANLLKSIDSMSDRLRGIDEKWTQKYEYLETERKKYDDVTVLKKLHDDKIVQLNTKFDFYDNIVHRKSEEIKTLRTRMAELEKELCEATKCPPEIDENPFMKISKNAGRTPRKPKYVKDMEDELDESRKLILKLKEQICEKAVQNEELNHAIRKLSKVVDLFSE